MKSFIVVLTGRILQMLMAFVALRAMSTLLGPEQMGRLSLINAVVAFFALVLVNPTGMYINRRLHSWRDSGVLVSKLIQYFFFILAIACVAALIIPGVQAAFGHPWPIDNVWLVSLVAGYLIITTFNQTLIPSLNILGHRISWLIFSTCTLVAALGFSLVLAERSPTAEFWQMGQLAGYLLGFLLALPFFIKFIRTKKSASANADDSLSVVLAFTLPLSLSVSLNWVQFQSYRLVISQWIGLEELGKFVGVYTLIAGLMAAFENLVQQYFYPDLYAKSASADPRHRAEAWREFASIALPATTIGGFTLLAAGRPLVRIMLAPSFQDAAGFILVAVIAETCRVCANIYLMAGQVSMKTSSMILPQVASAIILAVLVPVSFLGLRNQTQLAFLLALGVPAVVLVVMSAVFAHRRLHLSVRAGSFLPAIMSLFAAALFYFLNERIYSRDTSGASVATAASVALELVFVGMIFSSFMLWALLRWRKDLELTKVSA